MPSCCRVAAPGGHRPGPLFLNKRMSETEQIKQISIVAFLSELGFKIQRRGSHLFVLCPIHGERSASMAIYPNKNKWHCFGCAKHGDIFDLAQSIWNCNFIEAKERLKKYLSGNLPSFEQVKKQFEIIDRPALRILKKFPVSSLTGAWYWAEHGVPLTLLHEKGLYYVAELAEEMRIRKFGNDVPCFAYDSGEATKLYMPTHLKQYRHAWVGNTITKEKFWPSLSTFSGRQIDTLYLCAGQKDALVMMSRGYEAVTSTGSESAEITPEMAAQLRVITPDVQVLYDTDQTGRTRSKKICEDHGFKNVLLPAHDSCKDISDFAWQGIFKKDSTLQLIGATIQ